MKLGLTIDLDTCVGCNACAVACKEWSSSGTLGPPDKDQSTVNAGGWLNRIINL